jgi:hypothetical protein
MSIDLPLDNMTLADKREAMEVLWVHISRIPSDPPSPVRTNDKASRPRPHTGDNADKNQSPPNRLVNKEFAD